MKPNKLPDFGLGFSGGGSLSLSAGLRARGMTTESTKYCLVVEALLNESLCSFTDLVERSPPETLYSTIKQRLIGTRAGQSYFSKC
jgi:hypothetical protein